MRILREGSRGPAVQLLQLALDRAGFGPLRRDGRFGPVTAAALRDFQREMDLRPDGVAGALTHRALRPWYTGYLAHRVQRGESFWSISRLYGVSLDALRSANPALAPESLPLGAMLTVPLNFPVVPTDIDFFSALAELCVEGLAARYPFFRAGTIGRSVLGRPIRSLLLGQGVNRVLYNAEHHANEWITTPVLLRFAEELGRAAAEDGALLGTAASEILDYASILLVPAVNPDGMDLCTGELREGRAYEEARRIAARWPRFPFPDGWKANIQGVDLNLQYPAGWEQARENKFALGITSPAPADYVGSAPLEAPESRALYACTRAFDPALTLSLHTQGELIYWKYLDLEVPGAEQIAGLFSDLSGYAAEDTPYASGFAGYKDWFIQDYRRPGFTLELGRGVNPLPIGDLDAIYARVRGILTLAALVT